LDRLKSNFPYDLLGKTFLMLYPYITLFLSDTFLILIKSKSNCWEVFWRDQKRIAMVNPATADPGNIMQDAKTESVQVQGVWASAILL
jgi:hypothetical protein